MSTDAEKVFDSIQLPFMRKTLRKLGIKVNNFSTYTEYLQKNPETNTKLNGKKKWWYPSKIKNKARMSSLTTLIQYSTET